MSSLWTNLLFMHGHITDLDLVRRLASEPTPPARPTGKRERTPKATSELNKTASTPVALAQGGCA